MEITKSLLKKLVKEEMALSELEAPAGQADVTDTISQEPTTAADLKKKLMNLSKSVAGIQPSEVDLVEYLIDVIELAKHGNINVTDLRVKLGLVQQITQKLDKK